MVQPVDQYMEGLITVEELTYKMLTISDARWVKDALSFLNDTNYNLVLEIIRGKGE